MRKARNLVGKLMRIMRKDEMRILPGELAFFMVLSFFAIFPIIGIIGSNYINSELINIIDKNFPSAVTSIVESLIDVNSSGMSLIMFVLFLLFAASNGCEALIITSNFLYKVKNKNILHQKVKAIFMTLILISLILFIVVVPAFGEVIIKVIGKIAPGEVIDTVRTLFDLIKYPLSFVMIFIDLKILYAIAPSTKIPSKYNNYGTLFTTILWIIITKGYSVYLNSFNSYNIFYGSFGNVVVMLFWMYILAYILTIGLVINSNRYHESQDNVKLISEEDTK